MEPNSPVGDEDGEEMVSKAVTAVAVAVILFHALPASAVDTVTSATVSSSTVVDKTPPTASSPSIVVNSSTICQTGTSGALQTSLFGISGGTTTRDLNCELILLARSVYGMGLKVAGISILCQDVRVWNGLWQAGSPCPYLGAIGDESRAKWLSNPDKSPEGSIIRVAAKVEADKKEVDSTPDLADPEDFGGD
tara:strand:+ start:2133 stop:2711 length:579 start_codon:yes stop_codon:yes gene_type:complete